MHRKQLRAIGDRLLRLILIHNKIELVKKCTLYRSAYSWAK